MGGGAGKEGVIVGGGVGGGEGEAVCVVRGGGGDRRVGYASKSIYPLLLRSTAKNNMNARLSFGL